MQKSALPIFFAETHTFTYPGRFLQLCNKVKIFKNEAFTQHSIDAHWSSNCNENIMLANRETEGKIWDGSELD